MTGISNETQSRKVIRGRPYSIAEFAKKYRLEENEARRLYSKFGPSATELDLLMAAKRRPPMMPSTLEH
jgi:hypothetical protein